jgi:hypothetical protein
MQALLALLPRLGDEAAVSLAKVIAWLSPPLEDMDHIKRHLLARLAKSSISLSAHTVNTLAREIARLAVATQDQARVRQALLAKLSTDTNPRTASNRRGLIDVILGLNPTVCDLEDIDVRFSPTPTLLAALRRNSSLHSWLTALPRLRADEA